MKLDPKRTKKVHRKAHVSIFSSICGNYPDLVSDRYIALFGHVYTCVLLYDPLWSCMVMYGLVLVCMVMHGPVWVCDVMYGYV